MTINEINFSNIKWVDCLAPTKERLIEMADILQVPRGMMLSCLDPDYLPSIDLFNDVYFLMLRASEPAAKPSSDTIQELTTKIAVFIRGNEIYTFHRLPLEAIQNLTDKMNDKAKTKSENTKKGLQVFIQILFEQVTFSYDKPLTVLDQKTDAFEESILNAQKSKNLLRDGLMIKRKASAYKKVVKFTSDVLSKTSISLHIDYGSFGYIKEKLDRYQFYADDVFENIQGLLNLHIAIQSQKTNEASYRTNEIVRVLTVLTIFFLPLNFIAGVYGMNFEHMPLVKSTEGFWVSIGLMAVICTGLLGYVVQKGWLTPPPKD